MTELIIKYVSKGTQVAYIMNPEVKDNRIHLVINESNINVAIIALDSVLAFIANKMDAEQLQEFNNIKQSILTEQYKYSSLLVHYNDDDAVKIEYFN